MKLATLINNNIMLMAGTDSHTSTKTLYWMSLTQILTAFCIITIVLPSIGSLGNEGLWKNLNVAQEIRSIYCDLHNKTTITGTCNFIT